jgi:hypothetical protein
MSTVRSSLGIVALLTAGLVTAVCASNRTQQPPAEYIEDSVVTTKVEVALGAGFERARNDLERERR